MIIPSNTNATITMITLGEQICKYANMQICKYTTIMIITGRRRSNMGRWVVEALPHSSEWAPAKFFNHFAFFRVKTTKSKTIIIYGQSLVSFWAKSSSPSWDDWDRSNVLFYIWSVWRTGNENQTHADTTPTFLSSSYKHLKGGSGQT